jgi:nicotinate-nucleotide pyrophosphorylase (carboxylating)
MTKALEAVFQHRQKRRGGDHPARVLVEIEIANLAQLREALPFKPDIILLDNMTPAQVRDCVNMRRKFVGARCARPFPTGNRPIFEISGGITLKNLKKYVGLGIERISVGALTHSAPAVDISMKIVGE